MPSRVACNAKKGAAAAAPGMVPDKNSNPDQDLYPRDGSIWDNILNDWLAKKSPTRSIVLDRQRQMNEERAASGGFSLSLPSFDLPSGGGGEISIEGLSQFSIDPTLKRTTRGTQAKTTSRGTVRGKKTAPVQEEKAGFSLPNFLKPYDDGKMTYSEMLEKKGGRK
eukprot:CAMPEP_0184483218 /NCGR_PEP_ID=MMETSP0113_2-20130426/4856_1 /TAXON_ID=91329 /ORGANISM="Norrisiella sphaerica, Strain BC52" /LENGTH=165 /DNA_ID=CAMNT_0026863483 /DNA_START=205 /DNA_END=702 /DNA_ORIENTATION=-